MHRIHALRVHMHRIHALRVHMHRIHALRVHMHRIHALRVHMHRTRTARAAHMHCACTAYTQVAGLDYLVSNTSSGLSIRVEGYSHRLPLMITKVVTRLAEAQLCPERFAVQVSEP
jgi:secreted Zn-dependent insulinase-like peptidase